MQIQTSLWISKSQKEENNENNMMSEQFVDLFKV